jgi:hypothetical protein
VATQEPQSAPEAADSNQAARLIDAFAKELGAPREYFYDRIDIKWNSPESSR